MDGLNQKFQEACDYFDFIKFSRCLQKLEDEGFWPSTVSELRETAREHFESLLADLKADPELSSVRISGDYLELVYDEGEIELRANIMDSETTQSELMADA